jgi:DMSO/TMAO reductase YedYZ molybdopterin-dependent catalytic subunit
MVKLVERGDEPGEEAVSARLSVPVAVLIGVLSVAAALAAGHLVAGFVGSAASPLLAVGNTAIDLAPLPLKDFAIRAFGTYDKLVLLLGMGVVLVVVAGLAGVLSRRRPLPGEVLAALVGLLGFLAALNRPDVGQLGVLAPLVSMLAGVLVFHWLHGLALEAPAGPGVLDRPADQSRRRFLRTSAGVAVGAGVLGGGGQLLATRVDVEGSRAAVGTLTPAVAAPPIPVGADFATNGTPRFITSNRDFYRVDTALVVPRVAAETWRLRVHGRVRRELELDFGQLLARPLIERDITLSCVSNEVGGRYVGTARWVGAPLAELLREAGVEPGADQLVSRSADGFTVGTPTAVVLDGRDAMLAVAMNGEPLPLTHGFPVRMLVPGLYGYVSATKWLVDLELTSFGDFDPYWVRRGWARQAPVKTMSRIDTPRPLARQPAGRVAVAGVAWAQHRGIRRVEVRADGGPWRPARLAAEHSPDTWRQWVWPWEATPGRHTLEVRATDGTGATQPQDRAPPFPDGATGWHSVVVTVT